MPTPPIKPAPQAAPHSLCPFMSGPILVGQTYRLFRAACAGLMCRLYDDDTKDCRFNDVNYEDLDEPGDQGDGGDTGDGAVDPGDAGDQSDPGAEGAQ